MSLEKIEQYIRELEAIKYYDKVRSERDSLLRENEKIREELSSKEEKLQELMKANEDLDKKLKVKMDENDKLKAELKARGEEIDRLGKEIKQLKSRIDELEGLKALVEGKSLKEAEEVFLKAKKEGIKNHAEKLFAQMRFEWEKNEKPKEVLNEAIKWLKHTLEELSKPGPCLFLKEVVDAGLPEKIEEIIGSEVRKRLDAEFTRRVEERSEQKAQEKLKCKVNVEWPNWYKVNVEPQIRMLQSKVMNNVFKALEGPWTITCDKCRIRFSVSLTPEGIKNLIKNDFVEVECQNINCVDPSLFLTRRHRIKCMLSDPISSYLHLTK